jgi:hypothetical protein
MYKAVVFLETLGEFPDLKTATKAVIDKIKGMKTISWQLLETTVWVEEIPCNFRPMLFYDLRDNAIKQGWMTKTGGVWID